MPCITLYTWRKRYILLTGRYLHLIERVPGLSTVEQPVGLLQTKENGKAAVLPLGATAA